MSARTLLADAARALLVQALEGHEGPEHDMARQVLADAARALLAADLAAPRSEGGPADPTHLGIEVLPSPPPRARPRRPNVTPVPANEPQAPETTDPDALAILDALAAHGVDARHLDTATGPQVRRQAFGLPRGTKVAKVAGLLPELETALDVDGLAVSRTGGRVLIDVPRTDRQFVAWAPDHEDVDVAPLAFTAGHGLDGGPVVVDLARAPHLLIAGTTGSGKSVALTGLLATLLDRHRPDTLRLHLIDPKRVELRQFEGMPQVEQFAAGGDWRALDVLSTVSAIMDQTYTAFERWSSRLGRPIRDLDTFNAAMIEAGRVDQARPRHVVAVDEFADLMLGDKTQAKEIETAVVRIAQLGRAAGIHLVLATQRPSREVFTGLIKANVPARMVFRVNSGTDSRIALDRQGAEHLLGAGDGLLALPGVPGLARVQSPAIDATALDAVLKRASATWKDEAHEPPHSLAGSMDDELEEWDEEAFDAMLEAAGREMGLD
ncbi:DNA translocase FtsK [Aeromicrobium sp. HA]|uniref:DNA translocase FtsK n=1 Tax=Aeromicrobium sp. HA TaxID=3009077 RepID=UPI0022B07418|nr:DNA translocase FtsK [Aeromicrobium sp. HA]